MNLYIRFVKSKHILMETKFGYTASKCTPGNKGSDIDEDVLKSAGWPSG